VVHKFKMPAKNRKRWRPTMREFKKMVALVAKEVPAGSVTDIFHLIRRRCPDWAVTPHRVRKALISIQNSSSKKNSGKPNWTGAASSGETLARAYPHDVVELRSHAARSRNAQWQWRGQVLRVAGYDDGETADDEFQVPAGHCSVFWLGRGLEQTPNVLAKESSLRVVDRPWVLGDRVARLDDPRSLGTIVGVRCNLRLSRGETLSPEVPAQSVRAVGGFRAEDWVASEASRWVGKIEEAVFRVEVELCSSKSESRVRGRGRQKPPVCVFQVSSEGLQGLEPVIGDDVTPQELSPHFPGQRVRAPARLWRQAEWIRGGLGRRSPRRGIAICGVVSSVECSLLAVRWLAGSVRDSLPPDEWVGPEVLRTLGVSNSSESWAIGDHVLSGSCGSASVSSNIRSASAVVVESRSVVDVRWADGSVEEGVHSLNLCPRPHVSAHDFLPHDYVSRSSDDATAGPPGSIPGAAPAEVPVAASPVPAQASSGGNPTMNQEDSYGYYEAQQDPDNMNADSDQMYAGYSAAGGAPGGTVEDSAARAEEILPSDFPVGPQAEVQLGVLESVNLQARTAVVKWAAPSRAPAGSGGETEEVSVFELVDHPQVDVRLGDTVLIPHAQDARWAGRVCSLRATGDAFVELLDGTSEWHDVRRLVVVDDGASDSGEDEGDDGIESGDDEGMASEASEAGSSLTQISEGDAEEDEQSPQATSGRRDLISAAVAGAWSQLEQAVEALRRPTQGPWMCSSSASAQPSNQARTDAPAELAATLPVASMECGGTEEEADEVIGGSSSSSASAAAASASEVLPFDMCAEDVEPLDHHFLKQESPGTRALMIAVRREMVVLKKGLLEGSEGVPAPIIVRTFSSRSDLFRAMVVGPPGTPYANVPFFFDFALPPEYPRGPPSAFFHAHYVGNERLNPNLYVDGKVCLSLLGTWSGPSWDPQRSTMLQVLVSLQGLVLVEEPYFNEPGHECDTGTEQGKQASALYNEHARILALRAALNVAQNPPCGFGEIVAKFFERFGPKLVQECEEALQEPHADKSSEGFRKVLAKSLLPRLRERWGSSSTPALAASSGSAASASASSAAPAAAPESSASPTSATSASSASTKSMSL